MFWFRPFLLCILILQVFSICEERCERISDLLLACSLPPLSTDYNTTEDERPANYSHINITGVESIYFTRSGPGTDFLQSIADAECFCSEARHYFRYPCEECFVLDILDSGEVKLRDNNWVVLDRYSIDCHSLGYFGNETLAYLSTTRSALPAAFTEASTDYETGIGPDTDTCQNICGLIRSQADECGLISLDAERTPPPVIIRPGAYNGRVLLNWTAGECMCALPVLRRARDCRWCIKDRSDQGYLTLLEAYQENCTALGYYGDSVQVGSVEERDAIAAEESSLSAPTPTEVGAMLSIPLAGLFACFGHLLVLSSLI